MSSPASYTTRSRLSASSRTSISARAKAEAAKAQLAFIEDEADLEAELNKLKANRLFQEAELETKRLLQEAELESKRLLKETELETKLKKLRARKEVALTAASASIYEASNASSSLHGSILRLDPTPLDPIQRTCDYVVSQASLRRSEVAVDPIDKKQTLDPPTRRSDALTERDNLIPDPSQDLLLYMASREMLSSSLTRLSDQPKDYRAWKHSFLNSTSGLRLKHSEEIDMLVKWLGRHSSYQASRLRTA